MLWGAARAVVPEVLLRHEASFMTEPEMAPRNSWQSKLMR